MTERLPGTEEQPFDVAVVGGGASGLAAALAAARGGASTCVIERDVEAGLTILATGNGRCNLSNAHLDPSRYRHPEAFREVAGPEPEKELQGFFESLGLMAIEEEDGRLYPRTGRAESVRDVLVQACGREDVNIRCGSSLDGARYDTVTDMWTLAMREPAEPLHYKRGHDDRTTLRNARKALAAAPLAERAISARTVIIACGGACKEVAGLFGLPHLTEKPALCPIACDPCPTVPSYADAIGLKRLDGLRVKGALTLLRGDVEVAHEEGEVLFRTYGLSGIAAFNLSRLCEPGDALGLDLFPELAEDDLAEVFRTREERIGPLATTGPSWFDGVLAPSLGAQIHELACTGDADPVSAATSLCKHLMFTITGLAESDRAQVRRGGIPLDVIELSTLAVQPALAPALHVCGEALDMDAGCGGYNLAWAWLSGLRAGTAAARIHNTKKEHA